MVDAIHGLACGAGVASRLVGDVERVVASWLNVLTTFATGGSEVLARVDTGLLNLTVPSSIDSQRRYGTASSRETVLC
ncbi:MAG: hypothetical protein AAFN70_15710, partial [Planctomycetota bacterium]